MPINISTTEYANNSLKNPNSGMYVSGGNSGGQIKVSINANSFKSGDTISGEVVAIDGKNVTLKLSDGQQVNARLDGNTNLMLGKILSFEVNSADDGKSILLRPLYSNLNGNSTVTAALRAASMPLTEGNISMTQTMLEEGMNINRDALNDMARTVNSVPDANPSTVVLMDKMGLPINELTVSQFENYRNFEHQIIDDVNGMTDGITTVISEMANENIGENIGQISDFLSVIDIAMVVTDEEVIQDTLAYSQSMDAGINEADQSKEDMQQNGTAALVSDSPDLHAINKDSQEVLSNNAQDLNNTLDINNNQGSQVSSTRVKSIFGDSLFSNITDKLKNLLPVNSESQSIPKSDTVAGSDRYNAINLINETADLTGKSISYTADNAEIADVIKQIVDYAKSTVQNGNDSSQLFSKLANIFDNQEIKNILSDAIKDQLTIKPEKIAKEGEVEELYNRIVKVSQKIADITGESNSPGMGKIFESAQNLNNNVNFMNEVNQFVNYVQLPLKMYQENAHGDLYVYSNKKNLQNGDGNLTALLHLDMEHLGPMDVFISMKDFVNVTTNFKLSSEELLDFIADNIDLLNERLTAKGYNMSSSVTLTDKFVGKDTPISEEFLKDSPKEDSIKNVTYVQFDVRA